MTTYFGGRRPRLYGHRGASGLAPENTLPAFALAAELGVPYLELDVHGSRDGAIVVFHDDTLDRTTDGSGLLRERSLAELRRLDAGHRFSHDGQRFPWRGQGVRIPTLEEVLTRFPEHCFNIEIKQDEPPIIDEVVALLERAGAADRTLLAAADDTVMRDIRARVGERIPTGTATMEAMDFVRRVQMNDWEGFSHPGRALQVPARHETTEVVTPALVEATRRHGLEVHVWTINDPEEMRALLRLGVDGLMSDLPGLLCRIAREPA